MMHMLSSNTQAILLLTAPLLVGTGTSSPDLLTPGEYKRLARHLREMQHQPADLVSTDTEELLQACHSVVDAGRLKRLLNRGFLMSQAVEFWQSRAIWVLSREDAGYPGRLQSRLHDDAPALLYGCGDHRLLESGGLAVVGSRHVDAPLIEYTVAVGRLAALAGRTIISGGAKGIDQAAMRGALEAGGKASGVLADSLEKTAINRAHRDLILDGRLVLISPFDPSAGFNVGNAMQRNKLVYALSDAALVVSSDLGKGGTWAGAKEQLDRFRCVPVFVRSTGEPTAGLESLLRKGAFPWPNPQDEESFEAVFQIPLHAPAQSSGQPVFLQFVTGRLPSEEIAVPDPAGPSAVAEFGTQSSQSAAGCHNAQPVAPFEGPLTGSPEPGLKSGQTEVQFAAVREAILELLRSPRTEVEVAAALDVSETQAKKWLRRLAQEGVLQKRKRSAAWGLAPDRLFP